MVKVAKSCLPFVLVVFSLVTACGGVGADYPDTPPPLHLLQLYPRNGETGVPTDVQVLAVFDDDLFEADTTGCDVPEGFEQSFAFVTCADSGVVDFSAGCYRRTDGDGQPSGEPDPSIMVLAPASALENDTEYCVRIPGSLSGINTSQLGSDIESMFRTAP
ncbi:MAG: hypothetical protein D6806_13860 [Deltaproteobacteria bacterium]|nr:MAG: hypothetical protein D6806_13860 [Deltaproteobacteria bacterium]